ERAAIAERQAKQDAEARRAEAEKQQRRAEVAELAAKASESVAMREKELARQALAKSQLQIAEKEFERGKFVEVQKILGETPEAFRDPNWRFLRANLREFTKQLSIPGKGTVHQLRFLPQGDRFVVKGFLSTIGIFSLAGQQIGDWIPATPDVFWS